MLWCLTPLSTVFQLYRGGKTTDLSQFTDKLYPIMLFREHIKRTKLVVIGTDCTCSCKSSYHTITTTTAPQYNIF